MTRKGMSLPVETIVIIAIAVLVMVVLVVFFIGGFGSQMTNISDQNALTTGCTNFVLRYGCKVSDMINVKISGYNATCGGETYSNTLTVACCKAGYPDLSECATRICKCPSTS